MKWCEIHISMTISKILVEHSHAHSFLHFLWLLLCYDGKGKQLQQRAYSPQRLQYVLNRECLPTSGTDLEDSVLLIRAEENSGSGTEH